MPTLTDTVGGSPQSDCICRVKPKTRIFANGQFSGHLIFYKKKIFSEKKKLFTPTNENFIFLKKSSNWKIFKGEKVFKIFFEFFFKKSVLKNRVFGKK